MMLYTFSSNLLCWPRLALSSFDMSVATGSIGRDGSMHKFKRLVTRGIFLAMHPINWDRSTPQKFNSVILAGWSLGSPVVSKSKKTRLWMHTVGISGTDIFRVRQLKLKWTRPERINRRKVNSFIDLQHFRFCSSLFRNAPFSHVLPYLTLWLKPWNKKGYFYLHLF